MSAASSITPAADAPPTAAPPSADTHLWPADRFYWAVIEAPGLALARPHHAAAAGPLPPGLIDEVAAQIPRPLDNLHAVVIAAHQSPTPAPISADAPPLAASSPRVIVCAIDADSLRSLPPATLRIAPASLPEGLGLTTDLDRLNLLIGAFEPRPIRRARTRRHLAAAAMLALAAALIFIGLSRRAAHADRLAAAATQAITGTLAHAEVAAPDAASLTSELARQRRLAGIDLAARRPPDASEALAALLAAWPGDTTAKPQSISIGPDSASLAVLVTGDPSPFIAALKAPPGWIVDEPRLAAVDKSMTRLSITMRPLPRGGTSFGGRP